MERDNGNFVYIQAYDRGGEADSASPFTLCPGGRNGRKVLPSFPRRLSRPALSHGSGPALTAIAGQCA